jgi:hypothetical protein
LRSRLRKGSIEPIARWVMRERGHADMTNQAAGIIEMLN